MILGASGSGKSLLLKICAGLIIPEEGKVTLGGMDLALAPKERLQDLRAKVGFVFQNSALISNMAIYDNVALPLRYHKKGSEAEVQVRVEEKMALFGVHQDIYCSIPAQLSLEMHRRAALARAFILDPELLLLDQPTGGLDSEKAQRLGESYGTTRRRLEPASWRWTANGLPRVLLPTGLACWKAATS